MTYAAAESSVQDGAPLELYTFVVGATTYRLTSSSEDETFDGDDYEAAPIARAPVSLVQLGKRRELEVTISRTHALATALLGNGIPPRVATLVLLRTHRGETESRQIWAGPVAQAALSGAYLSLRIPNGMDATFDVETPIARAQRGCQHMLYGPGCDVDRAYMTYDNHPYVSIGTVVSVTGAALVVTALVDQLANPRLDQWAQGGEFVRVADGESRSVLSQIGTAVILDVPFATLDPADEFQIYAGCDHTIATCRDKFDNVLSFGGHPNLINENPTSPTSLGGS